MERVKKWITALVMVSLVVVGWAGSSHTAYASGKAKTPPPPPLIQVYTTYSGYTYLLSSNRSILDNHNQTVDITAVTQAKSTVSLLGARIQLQEWSGTVWVDVGSLTELSSSNTSYFQKTVTKTARSGYFYRARITHFATQSGVTEQALEYTDYILVS